MSEKNVQKIKREDTVPEKKHQKIKREDTGSVKTSKRLNERIQFQG
jgi:hypothetical protein